MANTEVERLRRKLNAPSEVSDEVLTDYLTEAEDALLTYLNVDKLEGRFTSQKVQIARIYYERDNAGNTGVKSESYSEGVVSESTTYQLGADYEAEANAVLNSLARYRRVYGRKKTIAEEEKG